MTTLASCKRLLIAGGCRSGKTTLADALKVASNDPDLRVLRTDDTIGRFDWSGGSEEVARWLDAEKPPWIIEGVAVCRAVRKWLTAHPSGSPCDRLIFLTGTLVELTPGQVTMNKGVGTVWKQIAADLTARGVIVDMASLSQVTP